jgi:hypothetical protein
MMFRVKGVRWLLGPTARGLRERLQPKAGRGAHLQPRHRALWKGDAFWNEYLARFDRSSLGHNFFYEWLTVPEHQAVLLLTPAH